MKRLMATIGIVGALALGLAPGAQSAPTEQTFQVPTTTSLVELCADKSASDPMMTAAQNFCEGYMVGAYQVLAEINAVRGKPAFCLPSPAPTRNEAIAEFVQWANANPNEGTRPPADGLFVFLIQRFPCPGAK